MPSSSLRLTLVNNAKQTSKAVVLLPAESLTAEALANAAKSKLHLKKVSHIFSPGGRLISDLSTLQNGDTVLLSAGEDFIGKRSDGDSASSRQIRAPTSTRVIANKTEVAPEALHQLNAVARLEGMVRVVGLPDLHPGQESPIGAAYISKDRIYPALVDQDIGCGMTLLQTSLKKDTKPDKLAARLNIEGEYVSTPPSSDSSWPPPSLPIATLGTVDFSEYTTSLGTIGGGNHFAEFQVLEELHIPDAWPTRISKDHLFLLVHSGSRGLGKAILKAQPDGSLLQNTEPFKMYMAQHDQAIEWAKVNRRTIAKRLLECLSQPTPTEEHIMIDLVHNCVAPVQEGWLHRKGAAPSDREGQLGIIPGSRGHRSWLVRTKGPQAENAYSIAHGAGRSITRTKALQLAQQDRKAAVAGLTRTSLGSLVLCEDKRLVLEEAPNCYKEVDAVVADLVEAGIVEIVASLKPVVTYKVRAPA